MRQLYLYITLFLGITLLGQGNLVTISSTEPSQMTICGSGKTFTVTIYNPSPFTLTNITLKLTMPPGIVYQAGTVTGATQSNIIVPNKPEFSVANIPTLTGVTIIFSAEATCDLMPYTAGGGIIQNNIRLEYTATSTTNASTSNNYDILTTGSYMVRQPNLSLVSITNQSYTGNIGDVFTRCITIVNGGFGELSRFTLTDVHGSGLSVSAVNKGTWTSTGGINERIVLNGADFTSIGDGDNLFENGESITVCETINVLNCVSVASNYEASWGCNTQKCQSSTSSANVIFPNLIPNLVITSTSTLSPCLGQGVPNKQTLRIINTGLGQATNIILDINGGTYATSIDISSLSIRTGINSSTTSITPTQTFAISTRNCMVNPIGRMRLSIPFINSRDTVYLSWNTSSCCYNACTNVGTAAIAGWNYSGSYDNICQNTYLIPTATGSTYRNISGALSNNGSPASLGDGDNGLFNFMFSSYENSYPAGVGGGYWKFVFTLPSCLNYNGQLAIERANGTIWSASSFTNSGNVVTAIFTGPPGNLLQANISIGLTANCSSCGGGSGAVTIKSFYVPDGSCACEMGIACLSSPPIAVNCPTVNCAEGIIFSYFKFNRTNFGLPDNEAGGGNGIADATGDLNFLKVRADRAMFGDTIRQKFKGIVKTSAAYPNWQYCYISSSITGGNNLTFIDADLKIYRGGLLVASCNTITPTITNAGTTRRFLYNLSVPQLNTCFPVGFTYLNNDSIIFEPHYRVSANIGNAAALSCNASNEFYLSDIANPTLSANKFQCNTNNGTIAIIGYYFTTSGGDDYIVKSCDNLVISQNYYMSIGVCCSNYSGGNIFPNEYRNWGHIKTLEAVIPNGYTYSSARFNQIRTAGSTISNASPWFNLTPLSLTSNTLTFDVEPYFNGFGGSLPLSDDGFYGTLQVTVIPSCKVTPSINQNIRHNWTFETVPSLSLPGSASKYITTSQDRVAYDAPNIFMQATLPSVLAPNNTTTWDVCLSNTSNTSNALNTWLTAPQISGVSIIKVYDLDNNSIVPSSNGIYQIGAVNKATTRCFRITGDFTYCTQDSITIYSGWNCSEGYPTSLANYPCTPKSIKLKLTPLLPLLVANVSGPIAPIQLCDTAVYTVEGVNVQLGTAYDLNLSATLPNGLSIVPGTCKINYPVPGTYTNIPNPTYISGNTWNWDISNISQNLDTNGLKGVLQPTLSTMRIQFKTVTNCNYLSGSSIEFNLSGKAACGLPTGQEVSLSPQLIIAGAVAPYKTGIKLITDYISPCTGPSNMKVVISNQGPSVFNSTDSIIVQLPNGVSYVNASFIAGHNAPLLSVPDQYTVNGKPYLRWRLPQGIAIGDSSVFSFNYSGNPSQLSCGISQFKGFTTSRNNATCASAGNNCSINILTGDTTISVFTYKTYLTLSNGTSSSLPNSNNGESVSVNLNITNNGANMLIGPSSVIKFYYDNNFNGVYDNNDIYLSQGTFTVAGSSTISYSQQFNVAAGQACSIIAIIDTAVNACVCIPSQLVLSPRLRNAGYDSTFCSGTTFSIGHNPSTGYTYNWFPTTGLSNPAISNPVLNINNPTNSPANFEYILTTNRMGCTTLDTVKFTVKPVPTANFTVNNTCEDETVLYTSTSVPIPGIASYVWNFGDNSINGMGLNSSHTYSLANTYSVKLVVLNTSLCKDSVIKTLTIYPKPIVSFYSDTVCLGLATHFNNATTVTSPYSVSTWQWDFESNGSVDDITQNPNFIFLNSGTFTTKLKAITTEGCADSLSLPIKINELPNVNFNAANTCLNSVVVLNNTSSVSAPAIINTWNWNFGDGNINSSNLPLPSTLTYSTTGTKTISLLATSNQACSATATQTIEIYPNPLATFNFSEICQGTSTTFTSTSTPIAPNSNAITSWNWDFTSDGIIDDYNTNPSFTYPSSGLYQASLKVTSINSCTAIATNSVNVWGRAVPDFLSEPVCFGTTTTFTNTTNSSTNPNTSSALSYTWNVTNANTSYLTNPSYLYNSGSNINSVRQVTLTVNTSNNCTNTVIKPVNVYAVPQAKFTSDSACIGLATQLTDASNTNGNSLSNHFWDVNGDNVIDTSGTDQLNFIFPNYGNSVVGYTVVTNPVGNLMCSNSTFSPIWVHPAPVANFTAINKCINNQPLNFDASASTIVTGSNILYNWQYGDNSSNNGIQTNHNFPTSGSYNTTLTVTSNKGCVARISKQIQVYEKPLISINYLPTCDKSSAPINATTLANSSTITNWEWDLDNVIASVEATGQAVNYRFPNAGTHTINLIATTNNGCKDTVEKTIIIDYIPVPLFSVSNPTGCAAHCATFNDATAPVILPAQNVNWKWIFGDGTIINSSSNTSQNHCYDPTNNQINNYNVTLVVTTDKGCSDSLTKTSLITVYPKPNAQYNINPTNADITTPLIYFNNESGGYTKLWWNFGDGTKDTLNANPTHFYNSETAASYYSSLIVANQYGCLDTASNMIEISPEFIFYIPNCFTPSNEDGINDVFTGKGIGITKFEMWIYDRWGESIFYTDDINTGWNGTVQGKSENKKQDVYIWKVKLLDVFGKNHNYTGHVTLLK